MSDTPISVDQLAVLLQQTGEAHHAAYEAADGTDPEWAMWYSGHLQALLGNGLGRAIKRSEIVHHLWRAQQQHAAHRSDKPWPSYYARLVLADTTS